MYKAIFGLLYVNTLVPWKMYVTQKHFDIVILISSDICVLNANRHATFNTAPKNVML